VTAHTRPPRWRPLWQSTTSLAPSQGLAANVAFRVAAKERTTQLLNDGRCLEHRLGGKVGVRTVRCVKILFEGRKQE